MSRTAKVFACVLALSLASSSCAGDVIRLGDALAGAGGAGQSGGNAGGNASASGGSASGGSASGGSASGGSCARGLVAANEVLWIGDSWVEIPGNQQTHVRDLARASGAIAPSANYVDLAASAATLAAIVGQYNTQQATATQVKVLIMDGGTWDTIVDNGSDASVAMVVDTFQQFLAKVASDGTVQHIIYFLVPELPTIPGVAALRPQLQSACGASSVPCHFLDLQPLWEGHPEYTGSSGIQASTAGATVIAEAIWAIMQQNCVAQ